MQQRALSCDRIVLTAVYNGMYVRHPVDDINSERSNA